MEIKDKLKQKRQEAGLTQKDLSEILHVSRQTISSWEVGRTYPDLDTLVVISELYETPLDDLLKEDSRMVEDITKKVKTSERRKIMNMVLVGLLVIVVGIGTISGMEVYRNSRVNENGLSPNDLLDSTWQMSFAPVPELFDSYLSIGTDDLVMLNQYSLSFITPDMNPESIKKKHEEWEEKGFFDGIVKYDNMKVTVEDSMYIVTAYGYSQEFTKVSDTIIKDKNGIEYYQLAPAQTHDGLYFIADEMELTTE